jgi:hypothetical protein
MPGGITGIPSFFITFVQSLESGEEPSLNNGLPPTTLAKFDVPLNERGTFQLAHMLDR